MDEKKDIVEVSFNGKENYNNRRKTTDLSHVT